MVLISRRNRLGADHRGELGPEHLDGDLAVVPQVPREIHRGHAAGTQLALQVIPAGKRGAQGLDWSGGGHESDGMLAHLPP